MKLVLTRHAKSSWDHPTLSDHDRPLNDRGHRSAAALGAWMKDRGHVPDQVLCSSAARAVQTWEGIKKQVTEGRVEFVRGLYHASPSGMLQVLFGADAATVLMVGHNPGIAYFAESLVAEPPEHARFFDYPTGATSVIEFDQSNWRDTQPGTGRIADFVVPRDLVG